MGKVILNERDIETVVKLVVESIMNELGDTESGQYAMGCLYKRKKDNGDRSSNDVADHALTSIENELPGDFESDKHRKLLNAFHDGMSGMKKGSHSKFMGLKQ